MPAADRVQARLVLRERRAGCDPATRGLRDERIFSALGELIAGLPIANPTVALYWPMAGEPDPRAALQRWHRQGWSLALPRVQAPAEALRFCAWSPGEPLVAGLFGTRQLADCRDCLPDVVVMPCLGFDPRGYRLGYGGGYYDRTLARIAAGGRPCVAIGVAHDEAEISGFEPHVHDRALDWILTESRRLAGAAAPG